jgi:hypothetical protein
MPAMFINGIELFEDNSPERRGPERCFRTDAVTMDKKYQLYPEQPGGTIDDKRIFDAVRALVGVSIMRDETVSATRRRWIERRLPHHFHAPPDGEAPFSIGIPSYLPRTLACVEVPRAWPATGRAAHNELGNDSGDSGGETLGAVQADCLFMQASYRNVPYHIFADDSVLAVGSGPLAANQPAGASARPDEGSKLAVGWTATRYISREITPASRTITIPGGMIRYAVDGFGMDAAVPIPQGFPFNQYKSTVKYTWYAVPIDAIPHTAIARMGGRVNDAAFDFAQAGTLLYISTAIRQYQTAYLQWVADLTHTFSYMPNYFSNILPASYFGGWNSIPAWSPVLQRILPARISSDGLAQATSNLVFPPGDIGTLFRPDQ